MTNLITVLNDVSKKLIKVSGGDDWKVKQDDETTVRMTSMCMMRRIVVLS